MKKLNKKLISKSFVFFMLFILVLVSGANNTTNGIENEKIAYITFDDGPSKYTKQIVDILDEMAITKVQTYAIVDITQPELDLLTNEGLN